MRHPAASLASVTCAALHFRAPKKMKTKKKPLLLSRDASQDAEHLPEHPMKHPAASLAIQPSHDRLVGTPAPFREHL